MTIDKDERDFSHAYLHPIPQDVVEAVEMMALRRPSLPEGERNRQALAHAYNAGRVARWDAMVTSSATAQDAAHRVLHEFYHDEPFQEGKEYTHPDDCPDCPTAAVLTADAVSAVIAEQVRRKLVCCDIYDRLADFRTPDHGQPGYVFRQSIQGHEICYWGELAAQIAENRQAWEYVGPADPLEPWANPDDDDVTPLATRCGGLDGEHTRRGCTCDSPASTALDVSVHFLPWATERAQEQLAVRIDVDRTEVFAQGVAALQSYAAGQWNAEQMDQAVLNADELADDIPTQQSGQVGPYDHKEPLLGTRGFLGFVADGREFITYNHMDSYPSGLGTEVLDWLHEFPAAEWVPDADLKGDLTQVHEVLERTYGQTLRDAVLGLQLVTEDVPPTIAQRAALGETWADFRVRTGDDWYALLRRTMGDLNAILASGYMIDGSDFPEDSLFAEWGYIVDLDRNVFEVYKGSQREPHSAGRWAGGPSRERASGAYYPCKLVASWPLGALPADAHGFLAALGDVDSPEARPLSY